MSIFLSIYYLYISIYLTINHNNKYIINLIYLYLGWTSLMWAARKGYTEVVKLLLEHGAAVNYKDNDG